MQILVVEDEPKVARALKSGLERAGYEVVLAGNGEEGFFLASARAPDLVVLDGPVSQTGGASSAPARRSS